MKIAITGATGFIGRHILYECRKRSISPVLTGRSSCVGESYTNLDISNPPPNIYHALGKPDTLIHLAWSGLHDYNSLYHFENQLPVHYAFLRDLVDQGLKNLVVAGTCLEYGMQYGPLSEKMVVKPITPYAFAKNSLREMLKNLKTVLPFNLTWLRIFYLYGDGQPEKALYSQIKSAVQQSTEYFDMSGGEQLRDYLHVNSAADHILSLALRNEDLGVVNICSGNPISVRNLVEGWIREHQWPIKLNLGCLPYPTYEPMAFWGDISKLIRCLQQS